MERASRLGRAGRTAYALGQTTRVGWFVGQALLADRLSRRFRGADRADPTEAHARMEADPAQSETGGRPSFGATLRGLLGELRTLLQQDLANIEAGRYRAPGPFDTPPREALSTSLLFFRDLAAVNARRRRGGHAEVFRAPPAGSETLPRYYRQNFHYQTDGWLSARSAALYDHQVEVLFGGGADAMRRQALVPLADFFRHRPVRGARLLDVGAGTGRFLRAVKETYPRLAVTALDLSPFYLARARTALAPWPRSSHVIQAPAEALPFGDGSFDAVTSVYLLHELPKKIRALAAAEMARVLKPGGCLVLMDSLQRGDRPDLDPLLDRFPKLYHEPYYAEYLRADIPALFEAAGLRFRSDDRAFLSKRWHFDKPLA